MSFLFKVIGAAMILASSFLVGLFYSNKENYHIHDLNEMAKALQILRSQISFSSAPLPEAIESIVKRTREPVRSIFESLLAAIGSRDKPVFLAWEEALLAYKDKTYFQEDDMDFLLSFGKNLGYLDKELQLSTIDSTLLTISQKVAELNDTRLKNKKLFLNLGILGGILTVIVFI